MALISKTSFADLFELRFDAECYQSDFLEAERQIARLKPRTLEMVADVSDGNHMSVAEHFCDAGVRYLKGAELSDFFIDDSSPTYISANVHEEMTRAQVKPGDVLLSVIGTVGPVALVTDKYGLLSCSCKLAILRPRSVNSSCLAVYLASRIGQKLIHRRTRGSVQQGIILPDLRKFPVPNFTDFVITQVESAISAARHASKEAVTLYPEAEAELLDRIGWSDLEKHRRELFYIAGSDTLTVRDRIDAEHYQPRYSRMIARLKKLGAMRLAALITSCDKGTQPDEYMEGGEVIVIKSKNVFGQGIDLDSCQRTSLMAWGDAPARLNENDVVINSTGRGTLGRAGVVHCGGEKIVASVDLLIPRTRAEFVNPDYLSLFLNSPAGIAQSEQYQTGSSGQLHLYPEHVRQFMVFIPRNRNGSVDLSWQGQLGQKLRQAARAKAKARAKLEVAKQLLEHAITGKG